MEFTRHARNKCRLYKLRRAEVDAVVLGSPSKRERLRAGAWGVVGTIRGHRYRVVFVIENQVTVVITNWEVRGR